MRWAAAGSLEKLSSPRWRRRPGRKTADSDDGRGAHPEGVLWVLLLQADANLESVGEADPVQRLLYVRQHAHRGPVLRSVGPADPLHNSAEALAGIAEKVHLRLHPRLDGRHVGLPEVGEYVPGAVVHESENLLHLSRVLADGDVEICHIGIEGGSDPAVAHVEFGGAHACLGRLDASVHITDLCQKVLSARHIIA